MLSAAGVQRLLASLLLAFFAYNFEETTAMKVLTKKMILFFVVACAGLALVSGSRLRIDEGSHDLLAIGTGVIGVAVLVFAAKLFKAALTAADSN